MADVSKMLADARPWAQAHLDRYLENGEEGHLLDTSHLGGPVDTTTLVLQTVGRRSGNLLLTPLIYIPWQEEFVIVGSKGGHDAHPAWFLNLIERPDVRFQVAEQCYEGSWRLAEGDKRSRIWSAVADYYPPYRGYQEITERQIPVILLKPVRKVDSL